MNNSESAATPAQLPEAEKIAILFEALETLAATQTEINEENVWYLVERFNGMTMQDVEGYLRAGKKCEGGDE